MSKCNALSDILGGQTQQGPSVFTDLLVKDETCTQTSVYTVNIKPHTEARSLLYLHIGPSKQSLSRGEARLPVCDHQRVRAVRVHSSHNRGNTRSLTGMSHTGGNKTV